VDQPTLDNLKIQGKNGLSNGTLMGTVEWPLEMTREGYIWLGYPTLCI
jgi:hypothetical protein